MFHFFDTNLNFVKLDETKKLTLEITVENAAIFCNKCKKMLIFGGQAMKKDISYVNSILNGISTT